MSKAGNKILRGAKEALAVARGDIDAMRKIRVTPSCGCVFCDLRLPRFYVDNKPHHNATKDGKAFAVTCGRVT